MYVLAASASGRTQRSREIRYGELVCGVDLLFFAAHASGGRRLRLDFDTGAAREHADRFWIREILETLDELDDVAARAAAEALEETLVGVHVKRRPLLAVEGTQADEVGSAFLQLHVGSDEGTDIGTSENFALGGFFDEWHGSHEGSMRQVRSPSRTRFRDSARPQIATTSVVASSERLRECTLVRSTHPTSVLVGWRGNGCCSRRDGRSGRSKIVGDEPKASRGRHCSRSGGNAEAVWHNAGTARCMWVPSLNETR